MDENNKEENSKLNELQKDLYSRSSPELIRLKTRGLRPKVSDIRTSWQDTEVQGDRDPFERVTEEKGRGSIFRKLLWVSFSFFVIALIFALFTYFGGANLISANNIDIKVTGPVSVGGGESLSLDVLISNDNRASLESVDMFVEYPDGTKNADVQSEDLKYYREWIGSISPGQSVRNNIRAALYGEEGSIQKIIIGIEYRVSGSNAIFEKKKEFEIAISNSPVTIFVEGLSEVSANQDMELSVKVKSNSQDVLENLTLISEYPSGFTFANSDPKPSFGSNVWTVGDLPASGEKILKIRGKIEGQDEEDKIFRFMIGHVDPDDEKKLQTVFVNTSHLLMIKRPFVSVGLSLNGQPGKTVVAAAGDSIRADISWTNNLDVKVVDPELNLSFKGSAFDRRSVVAEGGFFRSQDNTIVWNKSTEGDLDEILPGETKNLSFTFKTVGTSIDGSQASNPSIDLSLSVKGKRISGGTAPEEELAIIERTVKVATDFHISSKAVRFSGPLSNSGPIPPVVEKETTYTVVWTVTNTTNSISNGRATAVLPSYVKWKGETSPSGEKISYNESNGEVTWEIGSVAVGAGIKVPKREVYFKIGLIPSLSQEGSSPIILGETRLEGFDGFALKNIVETRGSLSTKITSDSQFRDGMEVVAP